MSPPPVHKSHLASRDKRSAFLCRFLVCSRQELVVSILRKSQTPSSLSHSHTQGETENIAAAPFPNKASLRDSPSDLVRPELHPPLFVGSPHVLGELEVELSGSEEPEEGGVVEPARCERGGRGKEDEREERGVEREVGRLG
jgi:hypothetical protein